MIIRPILSSILDEIKVEDLPSPWSLLDIKTFSSNKTLWDFQQEGVKNAIKLLYLYFKDDKENKSKLYNRYVLNGLDDKLEKELDIKLEKMRRDVAKIIQEYYPIEDGKIKFKEMINRAAFWMATGSGKTLLIVKLIEILKRLMDFGEIPKKDILVLTHRDDLILQLKKHVEEFNQLASERGLKINLVDLNEYEKIKREGLVPYFNQINVFYYRSDLISDVQKEKLVDFRNYENGGNWYLILDEAHKGDKEESKRQIFYSIMSRNGFLFNFSATFVDIRDIITTAFNFNLEKFISKGYGKHIYILQQEMRAFKEKEDYNSQEKQKIVLKSLILLTYIKKIVRKIREIAKDVYHEPLMLTLVNTVNLIETKEEKPDLRIFFEEIEKIALGKVDNKVFEDAKVELINEFLEKPQLVFEDVPINLRVDELRKISLDEILLHVYNSKSFGTIEAILIPGVEKEAILKLKTSDKPFALIRIGNAIKWIKDNLSGYEVIESYENKSIFENLDNREEISILMGSRAFYEGWDSNRPNIILFINIGTGTDAKKFVIQSVGRGVRIEPIKNKRMRLKYLYNRGEDEGLLMELGGDLIVQPIETLFIFGTNRNALETVIMTLKEEKEVEETIELKVNDELKDKTLFIPVFKLSQKKIYEIKEPQKFEISEVNFNYLKKYFEITDDRIILIQNNLEVELLQHIKNSFQNKERYYIIKAEENVLPLHILLQKIIAHFKLNVEELDRFKNLENEIIHFKKIKILLDTPEELEEFKKKIDKVVESKYVEEKKETLKRKLQNGEISIDEFTKQIEELTKIKREDKFKDVKIKYVINHYYLPLLLSEEEKIDYIKHIIRTKSETKFIEMLDSFIENNHNKLNLDWWMFSKIDEHLDEIYIPYYDPASNKIRKFKPDFIFWISKGNEYYIVFVDPKGITHTEFEHKVDWFKRFFEENNKPKSFSFEDREVKVFILLYTDDVNKLPEGYKKYWFDVSQIDKIFNPIEK